MNCRSFRLGIAFLQLPLDIATGFCFRQVGIQHGVEERLVLARYAGISAG